MPWFSITARESGPVDIFIYDVIGKDWLSSDGVSAREFVQALAPHKARDLIVRINSPGGSVFDGQAIASALRDHAGHVETRIEGLAASIATVIALAGKRVTMAETASMMIHNPVCLCHGDAREIRGTADMLEKLGGQIADVYAARTGKAKADIVKAMDATTWFTAQEAKEWGFVDEITAPLKAAAAFDLSRFTNVPTALSVPQPATTVRRVAEAAARFLLRGTCDATKEQWSRLAAMCEQDPAKAHAEFDRMIKAGEVHYPAEPVGVDIEHSTATKIESEHRAYADRLKRFYGPLKV